MKAKLDAYIEKVEGWKDGNIEFPVIVEDWAGQRIMEARPATRYGSAKKRLAKVKSDIESGAFDSSTRDWVETHPAYGSLAYREQEEHQCHD
tara:strand:+ start:52751 stop:53026 length:276 start_codon:yes stop_codon:yes gene_type:complete